MWKMGALSARLVGMRDGAATGELGQALKSYTQDYHVTLQFQSKVCTQKN